MARSSEHPPRGSQMALAPTAALTPFAHTLQTFRMPSGASGRFHSLPALANELPAVSRRPGSLRTGLEAVLRHCDGRRVAPEAVRQLASWQPRADRQEEIPFVVARVVLQDFTGVPLLADLAAMRHEAAGQHRNPK